jgi:Cd(II)/Pb(II)-responsive transcriptional regulator
MKIGELALAAECTVQTVRFYEKEGLLPEPARSEGNFRLYSAEHLKRLRFVRNCRALDMSHVEIRALLKLVAQRDDNCESVDAMFDHHIGHVDQRIQELIELKQQLGRLRAQCQSTAAVDACGILQGLERIESPNKGVRRTHLG